MKKRSAVGIALTPVLEKDIGRLIKAGRYRSRSEAVREAVRLLVAREKRYKEELKRLRADIAQGVAEIDRGEGMDGDEFMRQWAAREERAFSARRKSAKA
jgi:antitoxin ParD1/3/4